MMLILIFLIFALALQSVFLLGLIYLKIFFKKWFKAKHFTISKYSKRFIRKLSGYTVDQIFVYMIFLWSLMPLVLVEQLTIDNTFFIFIPYMLTLSLSLFIDIDKLVSIDNMKWRTHQLPKGVVFAWEKWTLTQYLYKIINITSFIFLWSFPIVGFLLVIFSR